MRVFLTVGTQLPFDRLVAGLDAWAEQNPGAEIFGQIAGGTRPRHFEALPFLEPAEADARMGWAEILVAHAGMGTIIKALALGRPMVLMARQAALGEQRNDHQIATLARFSGRPDIFAAGETAEVAPLLDRLLAEGRSGEGGPGIAPAADPGLVAAIRRVILD